MALLSLCVPGAFPHCTTVTGLIAKGLLRSLLPPATSSTAGSVGRQSWQKTPFCCLLHVSNSSLLLPHCMSRPFPELLPAQPARRSLCHTRWNWLDTDKSKSREKILPKRLQPSPSACPPCTPCSPPSRHLASLPPALLSLRVGNCSDSLSAAAASSLLSSLFPRAEETSHSCAFIYSQVKTLSPSPPPFPRAAGTRSTLHFGSTLSVRGWPRKGCFPGGSSDSLWDAIGRAPHKEGPRSQAPRKVSKPSCATCFVSSCQGDEFPFSAL